MPRSLGPRFALEAGFLILLAVVLGFADLSPLLIILIMALAWILVSLIEYFAWRQGPRFPARYAAVTGPPIEQEQIVVEEEPAAAAPPPPPPPPRPEPAPPPPEEQTIAQPMPAEAQPETAEQAEERERLAFEDEQRHRVRHRLEPLKPRPRRRFWLFGPRESADESSSEEER
jgi:hypothetical protein